MSNSPPRSVVQHLPRHGKMTNLALVILEYSTSSKKNYIIHLPIRGKRTLGWLHRYSSPENDQGLEQSSYGGSRHLHQASLLSFTSHLAPSSMEPVFSTAHKCSFICSSHGVGGKESAQLTCSYTGSTKIICACLQSRRCTNGKVPKNK